MDKILEKLELNKILTSAASFAVLEQTKRKLLAEIPQVETSEAEKLLDLTAEADAALFRYGVGRIEQFAPCEDELERAQKGASLSCGELLAVCALLRSARIAYRGVTSLPEEVGAGLKDIAAGSTRRDDVSIANDIECVCALAIKELKLQGLTDAAGDYMEPHAYSIMAHIKDETVRNLHVMEG